METRAQRAASLFQTNPASTAPTATLIPRCEGQREGTHRDAIHDAASNIFLKLAVATVAVVALPIAPGFFLERYVALIGPVP